MLTDLSCTGTIAEFKGDLVQVIFIDMIHPVFGTIEVVLNANFSPVLNEVTALLPPTDIPMIVELFFGGMVLASDVLAEGIEVMKFAMASPPSTLEDGIALWRGGSCRYLD